jgi:hypothetical protein
MFSILHISDLHRSQDEPVSNDSLVAALLRDSDRYIGETPAVPSPDAIVVSGDLIQGARIGHTDWQEVMSNQYRVAEDFLDKLAQRFLGGDRSKLIIVPGNHDVCWNTSLASMERIQESEYPEDIRQVLAVPDSSYRWSWKELALYRIRDTEIYRNRMNAYWDFVESFYVDTPLLKPIDRRRGFQLFELQDRQIIVAAFDSISGNDCFAYSGAIPQGAVARCDINLRDIEHSYGLRIAVWHHSTHGPPSHDDYMEVGEVEEMAGLGFQLGMHGHQHFAAATTHYVHSNESQAMAVVSAGSLCAGSRELPRGVNRQYNLVVIEDDLRRARVHVREMVEGGQFSRKTSGAFLHGFVEIGWQASTNIMGREINVNQENIRRATLQADDALNMGDPQKAIELLQFVDLTAASHARKIAIESTLKLGDWKRLFEIIDQPQSTEEAVYLVSAFIKTNDLDKAAIFLNSYHDIDATTRNELEGKIEVKKMLRGQ